jgi:hypothetical protein
VREEDLRAKAVAGAVGLEREDSKPAGFSVIIQGKC